MSTFMNDVVLINTSCTCANYIFGVVFGGVTRSKRSKT